MNARESAEGGGTDKTSGSARRRVSDVTRVCVSHAENFFLQDGNFQRFPMADVCPPVATVARVESMLDVRRPRQSGSIGDMQQTNRQEAKRPSDCTWASTQVPDMTSGRERRRYRA